MAPWICIKRVCCSIPVNLYQTYIIYVYVIPACRQDITNNEKFQASSYVYINNILIKDDQIDTSWKWKKRLFGTQKYVYINNILMKDDQIDTSRKRGRRVDIHLNFWWYFKNFAAESANEFIRSLLWKRNEFYNMRQKIWSGFFWLSTT